MWELSYRVPPLYDSLRPTTYAARHGLSSVACVHAKRATRRAEAPRVPRPAFLIARRLPAREPADQIADGERANDRCKRAGANR